MNSKSSVPSPCISVCTLDEATGYCNGCMRNIDEIADWDSYNDTQKQAVLDQLKQRKEFTKGEEGAHC